MKIETQVVPMKIYIPEERMISDTISTPLKTIVQTPTINQTPSEVKVKNDVIKMEIKPKKIPEKHSKTEKVEVPINDKKQPKKFSSREHEEKETSKDKTSHIEKKPKIIRKIEISETESSESEEVKEKPKLKPKNPQNIKEIKVSQETSQPNYIRDYANFGSEIENFTNLLNEKDKINKCLEGFDYFIYKDWQTDPIKFDAVVPVVTSTTSTQYPEDQDIINRIVDTIEPITIAQTQLNMLIETLDKLKYEGSLTHLNLTKEDIELIKGEMKALIESKVDVKPLKNIMSGFQNTSFGSSSFKSSGILNLGMRDPSLHYTNNDKINSVSPRNPPKLSTSMIVKFWRKAKKK